MPASYVDQQLRTVIGTTVKRRLKELGWSQDVAAGRIGINRTAFNRAINGHATPRGETLAKICDVLEVSIRIGDKDLKASDFSPRIAAPAGSQPEQYVIAYDRPVQLHIEGRSISIELIKKPHADELELKVRLPEMKLAG